MQLIKSLSFDENGTIISAELILIVTIVILGLMVGLADLTQNVNDELIDLGNIFDALNPLGLPDGSGGNGNEGPIDDILCDLVICPS